MKLFVYSYREFDEAEFFQKFAEEYHVELGICHDAPTMENAYLAEGYPYVSIITTKIDEELMNRFHALGVKMISTRTIGYDHIDLEAARKCGISVGNVMYSPECVADYTVMLMLMSIRKMKRIMQREEINDFSLPGIQGKEMPSFTVGVIGTGRIGRAVIRDISGFGCKIYAYDQYENDEVKKYAQYASLDEIYEKCDMITLHMPLTKENMHLIDAEAIQKMQDGVVLINTARGGLIDTKALIDGLESCKIGAAGLDVIEDEFGMYYFDRKADVLSKRDLYILRGFPNVIVTPHMAFYTDQAVSDMVKHSIESCMLHEAGKDDPCRVI
ncbi:MULTISPECIES: D-isomer specific 2-hydroxyacid dehydrogenase family protein [Clostridia]|uniref:D-isomer specific 2-hydroxyacid dehydrogenase family protein n=1 Tax=Clostridia TaxID=186801 RepID=UPI000EAD48D7|nr:MULTISPECIES: D-isomer specific 2-hydroxyacid dehydrogenase family protein [Clostridia]RKQ26901.1 lactate dehydrogenase [Ruminococcus sp. B05]TAP32063.1 lactate dehydrogenase [Mediterraneibacter sp. gm002]